MNEQVMKHRGQIGSVEFDFDDDCLHGKLLYINDLVTYEAESLPALREEFRAAVDDYLETCEELGVEPNKPFKGSFNIRIGEPLHRELAIKAVSEGVSLNELCTQALGHYLECEEQSVVEHFHNHTHVHYESVELGYEGDAVETGVWNVRKITSSDFNENEGVSWSH